MFWNLLIGGSRLPVQSMREFEKYLEIPPTGANICNDLTDVTHEKAIVHEKHERHERHEK